MLSFAPASEVAPARESLRCPRCTRGSSKRLGADWCCWELKLLETLMVRDVPPTMAELTGVHFIGRSAKSIDHACRRYGFKVPSRASRRKRCRACLSFACSCDTARAA